MTITAGITDAKSLYGPFFAIVVPSVFTLILTVLAYGRVKTWLRRLWAWWDVRCRNAQARLDGFDARIAARRQRQGEAAVVLIDTAALDDWETAIIDDPLPENTEPIVIAEWPTPLHPRLTDLAVRPAAPQPLPMKWEPPTPGFVPDPFHPQTYAGRAALQDSDMRDGVEVVNWDDYAAGVIRRLHSTVDAPVSPAPGMDHRPRHASELVGRGVISGTSAQRHRWETENTGSWQVITPEMIGVGAR